MWASNSYASAHGCIELSTHKSLCVDWGSILICNISFKDYLKLILWLRIGTWNTQHLEGNMFWWLVHFKCQIDLVTDHHVTGVITQGRGHPVNKDWTTSFSLSFSTDDIDWQEWEECGSTRVRQSKTNWSTRTRSQGFRKNTHKAILIGIFNGHWHFSRLVLLIVCMVVFWRCIFIAGRGASY